MSDLIERARALRKKIEEMAAEHLSDSDAVNYQELFPAWDSTAEYSAGDKVRYNGTLYKCLQAHTAQEAWTAEDAPSLWAEVLVETDGDGNQTTIKEWTQPDSTNPYSKGDKVLFEGKTYESLIDSNVWSPSAYPAGWKEITE